MTNSRYKINYIRSGFLISIIILSSIIFVKSNTDIAFSQTRSVVTTYKANESTYTANSSLVGNQVIENGTTSKDYKVMNNSAKFNSLSHNPTYSVTNATIAVKTDTLIGLDSNKPTYLNQTEIITSPQENVIVGQN